MLVACRGIRVAVCVTAVVAWLALVWLGATAVVDPNDRPWGGYAVLLIVGLIAAVSTLAALILHTMPSLIDSWRDGVDYGREQHIREVAIQLPAQGRRRLYSAN